MIQTSNSELILACVIVILFYFSINLLQILINFIENIFSYFIARLQLKIHELSPKDEANDVDSSTINCIGFQYDTDIPEDDE